MSFGGDLNYHFHENFKNYELWFTPHRWLGWSRRLALFHIEQSSCTFQHHLPWRMRLSLVFSLWLDPHCCRETLCLWTALPDHQGKKLCFYEQGPGLSCWTTIRSLSLSHLVEAQAGSPEWGAVRPQQRPGPLSIWSDPFLQQNTTRGFHKIICRTNRDDTLETKWVPLCSQAQSSCFL